VSSAAAPDFDASTDDEDSADGVLPPKQTHLFRRVLRDKFAVAGLLFLSFIVFLAIFAPWIARYGPEELFVGDRSGDLSWDHWLGTDHLGRDTASRLIFGSRVAVRVAVQVVGITLLLAVPIGLSAGFIGGRLDAIAMRTMDAIHSIPTLMLALVFAASFSLNINWALFGISLALVPTMARLVRAETLAVREETFIEASVSIGTPTHRILLKRVLPNAASPIIVQSSVYVGAAILLEASLSILGIGVRPGSAAWGSMLEEGFQSIYTDTANVVVPGAAIALTVLAANLLGDGLRDALGLDAGSRYGARTKMGLTVVRDRDKPGEAVTDGADDADALLEVRGLTVSVRTDNGIFPIVEDVNFEVRRGEVVGLVGESGSGKTVTSLSLMRLLPSPPFEVASGVVQFDGSDLLSKSRHEMRSIRGRDIAMIFQDPMAALNPSMQLGQQIAETIRLHEHVNKADAKRRAIELLDRVGIPDAKERAKNYAHEFSGGMRQRAMIAMALACSPKLLIADEPTTALDVTIQAQILELLRELQEEFGLSILFVTHDLGVVADFCDRVLVMYAGQIVEQAEVHRLYANSTHPYSRALLEAMPRITTRGRDLVTIPGSVPTIENFPSGCRFHPRCAHAVEACKVGSIPLIQVGPSISRCIRTDELIEPSPLEVEADPSDSRSEGRET
jgi:peptide/nickel transport system permease protein